MSVVGLYFDNFETITEVISDNFIFKATCGPFIGLLSFHLQTRTENKACSEHFSMSFKPVGSLL